MIARNGLDLSQETTEDLEKMLHVELRRDIDSELAEDINEELELRNE